MMHVAESDEIIDGVLASVPVMLSVVELKHLPGIIR
jgi:hypothetical protein